MPGSRLFALVILCIAVVCDSGCATRHTASGEHIYFAGTAAYNEKVRTFTVTKEQARKCVAAFCRAKNGIAAAQPVFVGDLVAIVGDCYVFSPPSKVDVKLNGYYVDGRTGRVEERWGQKYVTPSKDWKPE